MGVIDSRKAYQEVLKLQSERLLMNKICTGFKSTIQRLLMNYEGDIETFLYKKREKI